MRFMMLMYPRPEAELETSTPADMDPALVNAMVAFNQQLVDLGIMKGGEGLKPTRKGARVRFGKQGATDVTDGPFVETKEILGGYWIIEVGSLAEAIAWARKAPCPPGEMIEIREVYTPEDFGPEVAAIERRQMEQMAEQEKKG